MSIVKSVLHALYHEDISNNLCSTRISNIVPLDYATPSFPSLYWPYNAKPGVANYLYYTRDIWQFTLLWTMIMFALTHLIVAAYAAIMQLGRGKGALKFVWMIPLVYIIVAGVEALMAGSVVGLMYVQIPWS
jgi:hypothetical protein